MTHKKRQTTLFSRIMVRLTFPLIFLGLIFMSIQLTSQMNALNEFYKIESRFAFDSIQKILNEEMKGSLVPAKLTSLDARLQSLSGFYRVAPIQIFHVNTRASLYPEKNFVWMPFDFQAMEETLYHYENGKPYHVRADKETNELIAFIPIKNSDQVYIARVPFPLPSLKEALIRSRWTLGLMTFFILCTGLTIGHGLAQSIIKPVRELNDATREIAEGHLGKVVAIHTGDEIETLGETFNRMSQYLKEMKQRAEDANPLTQLPGNQGIFYEIGQRILERQKFVLFHVDLDRFKIFNDHYGLARGDEAIKKTADLLRQVVAERGAPDDFLGHQGGDDFVIVTRQNHANAVAERVVEEFDKKVARSLYRKEDYERGYTVELDRRRLAETGEETMANFPLLAISLAGVSNAKKDFADYFECMGLAVEIKKIVKRTITSSYMIKE